jgi:hypothetical protein
MADFPASPVLPAEFMSGYLPAALDAAEALKRSVADLSIQLGVRLDGDGGGEWVVHLDKRAARVEAGSRVDTSFTLVQSVDDWRGALWEGRGGGVGKQSALFFRPNEGPSPTAAGGVGGAPSPAALAKMQSLDGLMKMVVTGESSGDWSVGFKLGPGEIPAEATTTISLTAEDAAAMERGELNPMEAFMAGRIKVAGDMTLMMQMQAIQMQAAQEAAQGGSGG